MSIYKAVKMGRKAINVAGEMADFAKESWNQGKRIWKDTASQRAELKDEALYIGMNIVGTAMVAGLIGFTLGRKAVPAFRTLVKGLRRLEGMAEDCLRAGTEWAAAAWRFREELIAEYA